jgi:hypothetical protein
MIRALTLVALVIALASCRPEPPQPTPEATAEAPTPTPRPTTAVRMAAAPQYVVWLPVVARPEPVRGWAKAYSNLSDDELAALGIEWYYDYALRYPLHHRAGVEYIPFLWCDIYPALRYEAPVIRYFDALAKLPEDYSGYLLFLNEPDLRGGRNDGPQCERTPRQAAYMLLAAREVCKNCIMVGPAVSHEDYRAGWRWLAAFYDEVRRLGVKPPEVAAIHTYLPEAPKLIVDSLFGLLATYEGAPTTAWVTEFAGGEAQSARMIAYYESDPRIERYAWFTARGWAADLITQDSQLTPLGEIYRGGAGGDAQAAYP